MLLTATRIHDGHRFLPEASAVEIADDGSIRAVHNEAPADAQQHKGILAPGFVNAHCHLELSHLRGVIPQGTGLIPFLRAVVRARQDFSDEDRRDARHKAIEELHREGIIAVGDIANIADTADLRARPDAPHIHTFVESIGFDKSRADKSFEAALHWLQAFAEAPVAEGKIMRQSIVPHAPYSVSETLFRRISAHDRGATLSIHNQEATAERQWYENGTGPVRDLLTSLGLDLSQYEPSGRSSLTTYGEWIAPTHPLILVHNVDTTAEEIAWTQQRFSQVAWCLCPGANRYIEGHLPDAPMFAEHATTVCLGTDSLASNTQLSILAEMRILREAFPQIGDETLLRWATLGGAQALGMEDVVGSFEVGKKPGVLLLDEAFSRVQRLA